MHELSELASEEPPACLYLTGGFPGKAPQVVDRRLPVLGGHHQELELGVPTVPGGLELEDALGRVFEALGVQAVAKEGKGAVWGQSGRKAGGK